MQLFVLSSCPRESARLLDNRRVVKMIVESAQLLSTTLRTYGVEYGYKLTHINHPISIWVRTNRANYMWTLQHMEGLCEEYTRRYGKIHKCESMIKKFSELSVHVPEGELTAFCNFAKNDSKHLNFTHISDTHEAYRMYLQARNK